MPQRNLNRRHRPRHLCSQQLSRLRSPPESTYKSSQRSPEKPPARFSMSYRSASSRCLMTRPPSHSPRRSNRRVLGNCETPLAVLSNRVDEVCTEVVTKTQPVSSVPTVIVYLSPRSQRSGLLLHGRTTLAAPRQSVQRLFSNYASCKYGVATRLLCECYYKRISQRCIVTRTKSHG